jgi:hypothetical protein
MLAALNRQQTWREAGLGSSAGFGVGSPLSAPVVDETQGRAHVRLACIAVNDRSAVAAGAGIVATGPSPTIPITLPVQPTGIECGCTVLPTCIRRVVLPSRFRRLAPNSRRAFTSRDGSKPFRTDPCACKPSVQSHLVEHLSCARVAMSNRDTRQGQKIGYRGQFGAS